MITPRSTRLVRVEGLRAFRAAVLRAAGPPSLISARRTAVIVPSRSAAEQLRRAFEDSCLTPGAAIAIPHLVTRGEWLDLLCAAHPGMPRLLTAHEREVILESAARAARAAGFAPPFRIRPGLVAEMLGLYDAIRRHGRGVTDLLRAASESFAPYLDTDGGASRLLEQAQFLAEAFRGYESRLAAAGTTDEHGARDRLLRSPDSVLTHVVVAVGDSVCDSGGLWPADFDLLTRIHGLAGVDLVATEASLAAGLLPRLRRWLPGLSEERDPNPGNAGPVLAVPPGDSGRWHAQYRDREEEIAAIARGIKAAARSGRSGALSRTGVVFRRPLPYVYLASRIFSDAGVPCDTFDALPLAAEPYAAALDLVIVSVESGFTREAVLGVLRSPHFACGPQGRTLPYDDADRLDRALSEARFLGDAAALLRFTDEWQDRASSEGAPSAGLRTAAQAAANIVGQLAPIAEEARPAAQIAGLQLFLDRFEVLPLPGDAWRERHVRARAAVRGVLERLRAAHEAWGNDACAFAETAAGVRRWIGEQTFSPRTGQGGVQLLDAQAARFADLDTVYVVGVVRPDWPDRRRRSIFFPASFLTQIGWPDESDPRADVRASFEDVVGLAGSRVCVSSFLLDNDSLVDPSTLLDEMDSLGLVAAESDPVGPGPWLVGDALERASLPADAWPEPLRTWAALRDTRTPAADPRYHGQAGGAILPAYRVSAIDRYLDCPFKYFAADVLRLAEEPEDEEFLGPRARGSALHETLQGFFEAWQQEGRGAIHVEHLSEARALFARVVDEAVADMSATDAALQRASLLGSPAAVGAGEIVFQHDIERPATVVERLLEFTLDGAVELRCDDRSRQLVLKARADRIDLLDDGTFRLVDYKLTRAPKIGQSVQLAAYAAAARARLAGYRARDWRLRDAGYLTFGRPPHWRPVSRDGASLDGAVAQGEARVVDAVARIEQGRFPPKPADRHLCVTCPFTGVCRKDYVDDD